jgi:hypothetical protein
MDLINETLTWLQNGEPISGGASGSSVGVLNRPLVELLANDNGLQDRIDIFADDDGYILSVVRSDKITETDTATIARAQIDGLGLKVWDGTNIILSALETGAVTLGYGITDKITLTAGVLDIKASALSITTVSNTGISLDNSLAHAITISDAGGYGIYIEDATSSAITILNSGGYGLYIESSALGAIYLYDTPTATSSIHIEDAGGHGIYIESVGDDSNYDAIHIDLSDVSDYGRFGLFITGTASDAIHIGIAGSNAIEIDSPVAAGIVIDGAGTYGIRINTSTENAIYIVDTAATK